MSIPNANLVTGNTGTFYAVEIANPVISGSTCSATMNIYKQVSGTVSGPFVSSAILCHSGMVVRTVMNAANGIHVYIDNVFINSYYDQNFIQNGQPGVGVMLAPAGNLMSAIAIGRLESTAPNPISAQLVGVAASPTRVDIQFPEVFDNTGGTGVAYYQFFRSGVWLTFSPTPNIEDRTVAASTTYTVSVRGTHLEHLRESC